MKLHPDSNPMASFTVPNLGQFCYKKLFFVIVHSASKDEHLKHLQIIFDKPNEYGIIINPKKCIFEKTTVCYLGHLLSENGISPQPDKIKAVRGFFVTHHFSKIMVLFRSHQLLPHSRPQAGRSGHALDLFLQKRFHKRSKIPWTPEAEKAFHDTKLVLFRVINCSCRPTSTTKPLPEHFWIIMTTWIRNAHAILHLFHNGSTWFTQYSAPTMCALMFYHELT